MNNFVKVKKLHNKNVNLLNLLINCKNELFLFIKMSYTRLFSHNLNMLTFTAPRTKEYSRLSAK